MLDLQNQDKVKNMIKIESQKNKLMTGSASFQLKSMQSKKTTRVKNETQNSKEIY